MKMFRVLFCLLYHWKLIKLGVVIFTNMSNVILGRNDMGLVLETVNAQGVATPVASVGGDTRMVNVQGQDASGGDQTYGVAGLQGWTILNAIRYNKTDPGGSPANDGEWGSISDIFYNPIPTNVAITLKAGFDTSAYNFLLFLKSP